MLKDEEDYDEAHDSLEACRYFHGFYQIFYHFILDFNDLDDPCQLSHPDNFVHSADAWEPCQLIKIPLISEYVERNNGCEVDEKPSLHVMNAYWLNTP